MRPMPQLYAQRTALTCRRMDVTCLLFGSSSLLYAFFIMRCLLDTLADGSACCVLLRRPYTLAFLEGMMACQV